MKPNYFKKTAAACMSALLLICTVFTLVVSAESTEDYFTVKIVHTNDIHAHIEEDEKSGYIGLDRVGGMISDYTAGADVSLALDSGDTFHGQPIATVVKGESVAKLIKECGYTAMTPGNHDWSYGKDRLKELGEMSEIPILAGNITDENGAPFFDNEFVIKESTKNGKTLKIGIFGVIDPSLYSKTTPSNVAGLKFNDSAEYAKQAVSKLQSAGCNVIIALSHTYEPEKLAAKVDGVNLWLCGHEHKDIDAMVTTPNGGTAHVVESGYYLTDVSLIELDCMVESNGSASVNYKKTAVDFVGSQNYSKSANVTAVLETIKNDNNEVLAQKVGNTKTELDGIWEHLRIGQTNLGNIVTDAYLDITGADVAFENAGGIRASIKVGDVTYGDIIGVSPYGNYIVTKKITGKQLLEILETSLSIQLECIKANDSGDWNAWPENSGSYLQVGGVSVKYDPTLPEGNRIQSVKVDGEPLDTEREYTVATNNYVAESSVYTQLANAEEIGQFSACDEALVSFFAKGDDVIEKSASDVRMTVVGTQTTPSDTNSTESTEKTDSTDSIENKESAVSPKTSDDTSALYFSFVGLILSAACMTVCVKKIRQK